MRSGRGRCSPMHLPLLLPSVLQGEGPSHRGLAQERHSYSHLTLRDARQACAREEQPVRSRIELV